MLTLLRPLAAAIWDRCAGTRPGKLLTDGEGADTVVKFGLIGTVGYIVNQVGLFIAYDTRLLVFLPAPGADLALGTFVHPDARLFFASVIAVELSIISNFLWHERWTFRRRQSGGSWVSRLLRFNVTSFGSPLISVAAVNILVPYVGIDKYIANTIGVLLGVGWNWTCNTRLVWRRTKASSAAFAEAGSTPRAPNRLGD